MEDHLIENMKQFRFGFGLLGEQGVESIHRRIHEIGRKYSGIVKEPEKRLKLTIEDHHVSTLPAIKQLIPEKKKRSKKVKKN